MGYREVLLVSSGLAVLALAGVISNLDMDMEPRAGSFHTLAELVPLGLVIVTTNTLLFHQAVQLIEFVLSESFPSFYCSWCFL